MNQPKVSVIVTIYNRESILRQCLDSIINQTLKDIEILLINDGSTDNSKAIIDEYAKNDSRIKAIHKENQGYGAALNTGIDLATGDYIGFIDSDDWIEADMYEKIYNNAIQNNTDITKCTFFCYKSSSDKSKESNTPSLMPFNINIDLAPKKVFTIQQFPELLLLHSSIWAGIYKREFLHNHRFDESKDASYQDLKFTFQVLLDATRITFINECLVHYRLDENSESSTMTKGHRLLNFITRSRECLDSLKLNKNFNLYKEEIYSHICLTNLCFLYRIKLSLKLKYLIQFRQLINDYNISLNYKYFGKEDKKILRQIMTNTYFLSIMKYIRQFLLTIRLRHGTYILQILGIRFTNIESCKRPAILSFYIKK